jgi:uncharacterized protein YndB with AHSA1/START domain
MLAMDERAPVAAQHEIEIAATPESVWAVLTKIEDWPTWNPDVKSVSMQGEVAPGTRFRWKAGPGTIRSIVDRVEPQRSISWRGKTLGIDAVHAWRLEPRNGGTAVTTAESFSGLVARIFRRSLQKMLDGTLERNLRHLKAEAERRAQQ